MACLNTECIEIINYLQLIFRKKTLMTLSSKIQAKNTPSRNLTNVGLVKQEARGPLRSPEQQ